MEIKNRFFSGFQTVLLGMPALFLLYLVRFPIGPLPTNLLELVTGILFVAWLVGISKYHFPKPFFSSRWQLSAVVLFVMAATLATAHSVYELNIGVTVPLGIWKGWFMVPFLYFLMLMSSFRSKADLLKLIEVSVGLIGLVSVVMLLQYFTGWFSPVQSTTDLRLVWPYLDSLSGNATSGNYPALFIAPFLGLAFISLLRSQTKLDKLFLASSVVAMALVLYFTKSYGAWLAIIGAGALCSFFALQGKKRWVWVPAIAVLLVFGLYLDQRSSEKFQFALDTNEENVIGSGEERLNIWNVSKDLLEQSPFWGVGPGQFQKSFTQQAPATLGREVSRQEINHALHPHNTFLMFWLSNGLLGLLSFVLLLLVWLIPLPREWRWLLTAPLLYYLAHGLIDTFYWKNDLAYSFWFFGGLITIACNMSIVTGKVEHGIKVGRELGFPTANIKLEKQIDKPFGVYIVSLKIENIKKRGLLYYGPRKTEGLPESIVCEITVFDFEGDLYGKKMSFRIGKFLRGPIEFSSPEELREQIQKDVLIARNMKF